ncbi:site-2 protease family protein [Candidatus Cerribacteria bacterium 'Amazon FNV 2010 28 9']|uniref:Site-2 protease family protein n=1 Tax=Candidatus Cerribacteria bacterium 'Amazon FNV 2010 28 9' TaxID=2081795 RepID=A0A317JPW5_9BACT|nr:MAG: site-2 protease family protein [Candidatus Cerribacteria bacterium 'Amazon FNV 2010 28 9']
MLISLLASHPLIFLLDCLALIISITIHECSHALVADKLGDPTPRLQGRITLNPLAHLDPIGTILLLVIGLGWGKPVEIDSYNFRHPRPDQALVAAAGPLSNLLLATLLAIIVRFTGLGSDLFALFAIPIISINVALAIFNLVPVSPLDGGKILIGIAPKEMAREWAHVLNQYGTFILLALIIPWWNGMSPISVLINPIINGILNILLPM